MPKDFLLDPEDFSAVINPSIVSETREKKVEWEYCMSFPGVRCMVKRPIGVIVNFLDEDGEEREEKLVEHTARVFMHELDHIAGKTMTHWRVSEGNIDIITG